MFLSPNRVRGLDLLDRERPLGEDHPGDARAQGLGSRRDSMRRAMRVHTRAMLGCCPRRCRFPLVFAVLLHDIGEPPTFSIDPAEGRIRFNAHDKVGTGMTRAIMERFGFSRDEIEATVEAVDQHMVFKDVQRMRVARLKLSWPGPGLRRKSNCTGSISEQPRDADPTIFSTRNRRSSPMSRRSRRRWSPATTSSRWAGSPAKFKEALDAVQHRQLEGTLTTSEEAIAWIKSGICTPDRRVKLGPQIIADSHRFFRKTVVRV